MILYSLTGTEALACPVHVTLEAFPEKGLRDRDVACFLLQSPSQPWSLTQLEETYLQGQVAVLVAQNHGQCLGPKYSRRADGP